LGRVPRSGSASLAARCRPGLTRAGLAGRNASCVIVRIPRATSLAQPVALFLLAMIDCAVQQRRRRVSAGRDRRQPHPTKGSLVRRAPFEDQRGEKSPLQGSLTGRALSRRGSEHSGFMRVAARYHRANPRGSWVAESSQNARPTRRPRRARCPRPHRPPQRCRAGYVGVGPCPLRRR